MDAIPDQVTLEFGDGTEDVEKQPAGRQSGINGLVDHDEIDGQGLQLGGYGDKLPKGPGQTVEFDDGDKIDGAPPSGFQQAIKSWPAFAGARNPLIHEVNTLPATQPSCKVERLELDYTVLILRADSGV